MTWVQALCLGAAFFVALGVGWLWAPASAIIADATQAPPLYPRAVPPGYDLIITCPRVLTKEQKVAIAEQIQQALPGTRCVLVDGGMTVQVVEKQL